MKTICLICKAVNPGQAHRCHNCGTVNGSGASSCCASSSYDEATRFVLMGHLCGVADQVLPSRVEKIANKIMATMANRKKPDKKIWRNR